MVRQSPQGATQELFNLILLVMNSNGKIILALFAGVFAGAALGVMFAPAKGEETRRRLSGTAKRTADALKEKVKSGLGALAAMRADSAGGMSSPAEITGTVKQHV
jgi:gas vesicle protein